MSQHLHPYNDQVAIVSGNYRKDGDTQSADYLDEDIVERDKMYGVNLSQTRDDQETYGLYWAFIEDLESQKPIQDVVNDAKGRAQGRALTVPYELPGPRKTQWNFDAKVF